ncbi:hypothetical protein LIPSTDRAFT_121351 [Lipomyces starkeyi NRRL Y-11557]|uniref:Uncharacterized protein n=1 Tax=Lipomyces starkeyi NRRL Y-11557 TaxID=675824 RepID=A0A1E3QG48_LIPST|nr:hypothetical protein LIPSTDRAFT_121351 [Lipomyces starkeyi NRRL Y-11557]
MYGIQTHILSGNNIEACPVNFFHQDWFEDSLALPCWKLQWCVSRTRIKFNGYKCWTAVRISFSYAAFSIIRQLMVRVKDKFNVQREKVSWAAVSA